MPNHISGNDKDDLKEDSIGEHLHGADVTGMDAWPNTEDHEIESAIAHTEDRTAYPNIEAEKTANLAPTVSKRSVAPSWVDPGPPPDGGALAWTQCLCSHLTFFTTFG